MGPGFELGRADRMDREHHVGVAQTAELGALPREHARAGNISVTLRSRPGIRSRL